MVIIDKMSDGYFVVMTDREALSLIASLSSQILSTNPNVDRVEFLDPYFTIAVHVEESKKKIDIADYIKLPIKC